MKEALYLAYRKLRPAAGIPFAFVLMSGAFLGNITLQLVIVAFGFLFIDIFGNLYNDYADFDEDIKNGRKDKFTVRGIIKKETALKLSGMSLALGILLLANSHWAPFALGCILAFLLFIYSYKNVRLKGSLLGYLMSFPYFILPFAVVESFGYPMKNAVTLAFFFYFQCIYILCQKDSTDTSEADNFFVSAGWDNAFKVTSLFAILSIIAFALISSSNHAAIPALILNFAAKSGNLNSIRRKSIGRKKRSKFVLMDFLSHYLFIAALALQ